MKNDSNLNIDEEIETKEEKEVKDKRNTANMLGLDAMHWADTGESLAKEIFESLKVMLMKRILIIILMK